MKTFSPLTRFLILAGGVYTIWHLVYEYYLLPDGRLDELISLSGVKLAAMTLNIFGWDIVSVDRVLAIIGSRGVEIQNGCNGLELMGLYMGFIIVYPGGGIKKRLLFLSGGLGLLFLANVIRIILFAITIFYVPGLWEQVHTYSSYFIFYPIVLTLWYLWCTNIQRDFSLVSNG